MQACTGRRGGALYECAGTACHGMQSAAHHATCSRDLHPVPKHAGPCVPCSAGRQQRLIRRQGACCPAHSLVGSLEHLVAWMLAGGLAGLRVDELGVAAIRFAAHTTLMYMQRSTHGVPQPSMARCRASQRGRAAGLQRPVVACSAVQLQRIGWAGACMASTAAARAARHGTACIPPALRQRCLCGATHPQLSLHGGCRCGLQSL